MGFLGAKRKEGCNGRSSLSMSQATHREGAWLGSVTQACNPQLRRLRWEDWREFEASLPIAWLKTPRRKRKVVLVLMSLEESCTRPQLLELHKILSLVKVLRSTAAKPWLVFSAMSFSNSFRTRSSVCLILLLPGHALGPSRLSQYH